MNPSARHPLDRLIWTALTTKQSRLAEGDALARRYLPDVAPFAALVHETPDAYQALDRLLLPDQQVALLSDEPLDAIDTLDATPAGELYQMTAMRGQSGSLDDRDIVVLGTADAAEMLVLTQKTKPGPFARRTHEMGHYIGIRDEGRLIAMAGERMQIEGYVEISAVCVDDEWRGKGLAARLMNVLRQRIEERGETAFLHVFSHNLGAIGLYERLGFEVRRPFCLTRVSRRA